LGFAGDVTHSGRSARPIIQYVLKVHQESRPTTMDTELATLETSDNVHGLDLPSTHEMPFDRTDASLIPDNLPPMDRGRQAWMFCLCACVLEMLIWGYGFSFGVFQDWYTSNPPFNTASPIAVSAIGASALGIMALIQTRPQWMRKIMWGCLGLCSACLLLSSLRQRYRQLIH